jgi:hypothetical protein
MVRDGFATRLGVHVEAGPCGILIGAFAGSRSGLLTLVRLPAVNHMLQPAPTGRMEEYATIEQTLAPEVLAALDQWLGRVASVPSPSPAH